MRRVSPLSPKVLLLTTCATPSETWLQARDLHIFQDLSPWPILLFSLLCDSYTLLSRQGRVFLLVPRVCQRLVENLNCLLLRFLLPPERVWVSNSFFFHTLAVSFLLLLPCRTFCEALGERKSGAVWHASHVYCALR